MGIRTIIFRGKRTDNGEWVERVVFPPANTLISYQHELIDGVNTFMDFCVLPDTVGQYTGLTDKNGKKIFDGDIVRYNQTDGAKWNGKTILCTGKVVYNDKTASFAVNSIDEIGAKNYDYFPIKNIEVIGNIHDNPELLKGGAE